MSSQVESGRVESSRVKLKLEAKWLLTQRIWNTLSVGRCEEISPFLKPFKTDFLN